MTERKVLNKYFPPDYDPSKIPRLKRGHKSRQFNIRTMAPFNMRCLTCCGYIYKAKKFNSRMEVAEGVEYLGLRHYRFYIRCPTCCAEIIWRTDLESNDYVIESGAKRNFEALKTAEELEVKRAAEEEEELANNPMKLLEKRTNQSRNEMETAEALDDLKQLNKRQAGLETDTFLLRRLWGEIEAEKEEQEKEDENFIKQALDEQATKCKIKESSLYPNLSLINHFASSSKCLASHQSTASVRTQMKNIIKIKRSNSQQNEATAELKKRKDDAVTSHKTDILGLGYSDNSDNEQID